MRPTVTCKRLSLALAQHFDVHRFADRRLRDESRQAAHGRDVLAVELRG